MFIRRPALVLATRDENQHKLLETWVGSFTELTDLIEFHVVGLETDSDQIAINMLGILRAVERFPRPAAYFFCVTESAISPQYELFFEGVPLKRIRLTNPQALLSEITTLVEQFRADNGF